MRRRKGIIWLLLPVVLLALLLPGCFTSALWGTDLDDTSLTSNSDYEHDEHVPVWAMIVFTPFALVLDCLTWPIQEFFADEKDEEDEDYERMVRHKQRYKRRKGR